MLVSTILQVSVSERAMSDKTLVLGLLLACIANVICLAGYL